MKAIHSPLYAFDPESQHYYLPTLLNFHQCELKQLTDFALVTKPLLLHTALMGLARQVIGRSVVIHLDPDGPSSETLEVLTSFWAEISRIRPEARRSEYVAMLTISRLPRTQTKQPSPLTGSSPK